MNWFCLQDMLAADPPRLPLPDHVDRLVSRNRSARRLKFTKVLLGFHPVFDRSMILRSSIGTVCVGSGGAGFFP